MKLSIVTAVLNRADTIGIAVSSLAAQTHAPVEHIVQDGGSTDGTLELLAQAEAAGAKVISEPDSGIYDALNKGIARTTGEIIGLLHSDDFLAAPDVLADVVRTFADPAVDAVYGDLDYVSRGDTGKRLRAWRSQPFRPDLLARGWMPPHPTLFLRRRVFEAVGLYDTSYRIAADYDHILRCFSRPGFAAVHLPRVLVKMRVGGASNRSPGDLLRKSREDLRALRSNNVGGIGALVSKNLSKLRQFDPGRR